MSRAYVYQQARAASRNVLEYTPAAAAIVRIDGLPWSSDLPANADEAASMNREADALVADLNRPEAAR